MTQSVDRCVTMCDVLRQCNHPRTQHRTLRTRCLRWRTFRADTLPSSRRPAARCDTKHSPDSSATPNSRFEKKFGAKHSQESTLTRPVQPSSEHCSSQAWHSLFSSGYVPTGHASRQVMPNLKLRHATQFVGPYKVSVASEKRWKTRKTRETKKTRRENLA